MVTVENFDYENDVMDNVSNYINANYINVSVLLNNPNFQLKFKISKKLVVVEPPKATYRDSGTPGCLLFEFLEDDF